MVSFTCLAGSGPPIPTPLGLTFQRIGGGVGTPDAEFSAHPHSVGLMPVCWRKEEMTAAFCGRIDFALF